MVWISIDFYKPLDPYIWIFYVGLGFTWAFHIGFTIQMISMGQSDLTSQGTFFSLVVILGINLLLIFCSLVLVSPSLHFGKAFQLWGSHIVSCYHQVGFWIYEGLQALALQIEKLLQHKT
ncbi:MAG: hypothetical protein V4507_09165 [Verrucomicrobiota bacterium]